MTRFKTLKGKRRFLFKKQQSQVHQMRYVLIIRWGKKKKNNEEGSQSRVLTENDYKDVKPLKSRSKSSLPISPCAH